MDLRKAVESAKKRDPSGYAYLYKNTYQEKYAIAMHYMKNVDDALDVLHDSYMKAWAKIDELKDVDSFSTWLSSIVVNTAKNALIKRTKSISLETLVYESEDGFEYSYDKESDNQEWQPENAYEINAAQKELDELLSHLSDDQRECMKMYYLEGLNSREIAEKLGCPVPTVKSRLSYAKKHLRKIYEGRQ